MCDEGDCCTVNCALFQPRGTTWWASHWPWQSDAHHVATLTPAHWPLSSEQSQGYKTERPSKAPTLLCSNHVLNVSFTRSHCIKNQRKCILINCLWYVCFSLQQATVALSRGFNTPALMDIVVRWVRWEQWLSGLIRLKFKVFKKFF